MTWVRFRGDKQAGSGLTGGEHYGMTSVCDYNYIAPNSSSLCLTQYPAVLTHREGCRGLTRAPHRVPQPHSGWSRLTIASRAAPPPPFPPPQRLTPRGGRPLPPAALAPPPLRQPISARLPPAQNAPRARSGGVLLARARRGSGGWRPLGARGAAASRPRGFPPCARPLSWRAGGARG